MAEACHTYGSVQLLPDPRFAKAVTDFLLEGVPDFALTSKGRECRPHVTLCYGFKDDSLEVIDAVTKILRRHGPVPAVFTGTSFFDETKDGPCWKADLGGLALHDLNAVFRSSFDVHSNHPDYQPHMTLAYVDPDFKRLVGKLDTRGLFTGPVTFTLAEWSGGDCTVVPVKLEWGGWNVKSISGKGNETPKPKGPPEPEELSQPDEASQPTAQKVEQPKPEAPEPKQPKPRVVDRRVRASEAQKPETPPADSGQSAASSKPTERRVTTQVRPPAQTEKPKPAAVVERTRPPAGDERKVPEPEMRAEVERGDDAPAEKPKEPPAAEMTEFDRDLIKLVTDVTPFEWRDPVNAYDAEDIAKDMGATPAEVRRSLQRIGKSPEALEQRRVQKEASERRVAEERKADEAKNKMRRDVAQKVERGAFRDSVLPSAAESIGEKEWKPVKTTAELDALLSSIVYSPGKRDLTGMYEIDAPEGTPPDDVDRVAQALVRLHRAGFRIPKKITLASPPKKRDVWAEPGTYRALSENALASVHYSRLSGGENGHLFLPPSVIDPKKAALDYGSGRKSTPDPLHTAAHELSHYTHVTKGDERKAYSDEAEKLIKDNFRVIDKFVSAQATMNPSEFVAEVHTALRFGIQYPPEIMKLYEQVGGPKVGLPVENSPYQSLPPNEREAFMMGRAGDTVTPATERLNQYLTEDRATSERVSEIGEFVSSMSPEDVANVRAEIEKRGQASPQKSELSAKLVARFMGQSQPAATAAGQAPGPEQQPNDHPVAKAIQDDAESAGIADTILKKTEKSLRMRKEIDRLDEEKRVIFREMGESPVYHSLPEFTGPDADEQWELANRDYFAWKDANDANWKALDIAERKVKKLRELYARIGTDDRKEFVSLMRAEHPARIKFTEQKEYVSKVMGMKIQDDLALSDEERMNVESAIDFVSSVCNCENAEFKFELSRSARGRAYYLDADDSVNWRKKDIIALGLRKFTHSSATGDYDLTHAPTMVHELGHMLEKRKPGVQQKVKEFLEYRIGNEQPVDMGTVPGGDGMTGEMVRKNHFDRYFGLVDAYYVGKVYVDEKTGEYEGSEILSMGIQALYSDPAGFIKADPEYARFVIGILRMK